MREEGRAFSGLVVRRAPAPKARPPDVSERRGFSSADVIIEARSASEQHCPELESGLRRLLVPGWAGTPAFWAFSKVTPCIGAPRDGSVHGSGSPCSWGTRGADPCFPGGPYPRVPRDFLPWGPCWSRRRRGSLPPEKGPPPPCPGSHGIGRRFTSKRPCPLAQGSLNAGQRTAQGSPLLRGAEICQACLGQTWRALRETQVAALAHACGQDGRAALASPRLGGRLISSACCAARRSRPAVSLASALVPWRLWRWPRGPGGRGKWPCAAQEGGSRVDPDGARSRGLAERRHGRSPIPASGVTAPRKWRRGPRGPFRPRSEGSRKSACGRAAGLRLVELCGPGWPGSGRLWSP
ncbi:hypothetical protein NN561_010164 [Cricetulus griseus]